MLGLICLTGLLLISPQTSSDYPQKLVGKLAPELKFESVLSGHSMDSRPVIKLKGNVTLLEFWFAACGPCRQAVPHFNKLVRQFKPKGLQAYAVTFDNLATVKEFLKEVPLAAPVAIDTARKTIDAYGVVGYPTTFLIGKDGKVLACTGPDSITEQVLDDALAGKPVKILPSESKIIPEPEKAPAFASVQITVNSAPKGVSFSSTPQKVSMKGISLRMALGALFNLEPLQSKMELLPDENLYDFEASVPNGTDNRAMELLKASVLEAFHLKVQVEERELKVAVFRKNGPLKGVTSWDGKERYATGDKYVGMPLDSIVGSVAYMMKVIGIDETADSNFYNFMLDLDANKPLIEQVKEKFGLDVSMEIRKLPFTIIKQEK